MVNCPKCAAPIDVEEEELDEGDSLICEECGVSLSVNGVSPLDLSVEDEEDLDDDDDDDFDDEDEEDDDFDDEDEDEDDDE